mmetsp:Transcript_55934/g.142268  ORF Transcript_55934/g.142268 Transcript_55934/m.142268 type:complete len:542 (+) Transcript_55934:112-1737(+)
MKQFIVLFLNSVVLSASSKPHILFLLADDMGWANIGYHRRGAVTADEKQGQLEVQTPAMDSLADEGIILDRHYSYRICGPSRSALLSGRLGAHVLAKNVAVTAQNKEDPVSGFAGIPRNMTGMGAKVKEGGYKTYYVGKWDAGMATWDHTPMGRGYETFFGYFHHAEDYWTQRLSASDYKADICGNLVDLWNTTGPARDRNGTGYVEEMFTENTLGILDRHDPDEPLFLFHSFHLIHAPLQVPEAWERKFSFLENSYRRKYAAMASYMDDVMGQIVGKLKAKGMWENTFMMVSSDNGGPTYNLPKLGPGAASNKPLKGGKMSDWEGGVRVNAFVSGGAIPRSKRGSKLEDYMHMADWYATFCAIAGVSVADERAARAGLPPVDGIDHSDLLLGGAASGTGKRLEIHHSPRALTSGRWKLITGGMTPLEYKINQRRTLGNGFIPFSDYLDGWDVAANPYRHSTYCRSGCLYDVFTDPYEERDVAKENWQIVSQMKARLDELNRGAFLPNRGKPDKRACAAWNGFYGPFIDAPAVPLSNEFVI